MSVYPVSRSADCTPQEAKQALARNWPTAKIASFGLSADGTKYEAKLVFAGENPFAKDDGDEGAAPEADVPSEPADDAPVGDGDGDSDDGPPKPKKDKGDKGGEKGGLKTVEHKLDQIMKALGLPVEGADEALAPDMAGPAGPMDGAPGAIPPAPPAAPAPDKAPLPPPAKPHGAPGGAGLGMPFSRVAALRDKVSKQRTFTTVVEAGPETPLREVVTTAASLWPEFTPVKVERRTGRINGNGTQHLVVLAMRRK